MSQKFSSPDVTGEMKSRVAHEGQLQTFMGKTNVSAEWLARCLFVRPRVQISARKLAILTEVSLFYSVPPGICEDRTLY